MGQQYYDKPKYELMKNFREPLKTQNSPHITPVSDTLQQIFCVFFIVSRGSLYYL
jgi:hypothetical protein